MKEVTPSETNSFEWKTLYKVGGLSACLFVILTVIAIILAVAIPPLPTTGGTATLEYIAAHRLVYIIYQQLWLVPGLFAALMYLALYPALKHLNKSYTILGTVIGGISWTLTLAMPTTSTGAPALVYLSDQYMATIVPAQKALFAAAAEGLIALNRTPTIVGILTTVGMLIVSFVMLKGIFPKWIAYLGITTGILGIVSEALRPIIEGGYAIYGILLLVWMGTVGWQLCRLGFGIEKRQV